MSLFSSLPPASRSGIEKARDRSMQIVPEQGGQEMKVRAAQENQVAESAGSQKDGVIGAITKISAHIGSAKKFSKASKLAVQLLESNSINAQNAGHFFNILEAAMDTPKNSNEPALRADYKELFSAVEEMKTVFSEQQQAMLDVWLLRAVLANELYTDDTFQFSRATAKVKQALEALPEYSEGDDVVPAIEGPRVDDSGAQAGEPLEDSAAGPSQSESREALEVPAVAEEEGRPEAKRQKQESNVEEDPFGLEEMLPSASHDPFGLDEIIPKETKRKEDRTKRKREEQERAAKEAVQAKLMLAGRREAVLACLEAANSQYKYTWAKTTVELLMKTAFDNISRFTPSQQLEVEKLWSTVRDEQVRRKQGKAGTHKLSKQEETSYERVSSKWKGEKISIRSAVGGTGDGSTVTWLG